MKLAQQSSHLPNIETMFHDLLHGPYSYPKNKVHKIQWPSFVSVVSSFVVRKKIESRERKKNRERSQLQKGTKTVNGYKNVFLLLWMFYHAMHASVGHIPVQNKNRLDRGRIFVSFCLHFTFLFLQVQCPERAQRTHSRSVTGAKVNSISKWSVWSGSPFWYKHTHTHSHILSTRKRRNPGVVECAYFASWPKKVAPERRALVPSMPCKGANFGAMWADCIQ